MTPTEISTAALHRYMTGYTDALEGIKPRSRDDVYAMGYAEGAKKRQLEDLRIG